MRALGFTFLGLACLHLGCSAQQAKQAEADTAYLAEQLACVDKNDTRAAIDNCRYDVRKRWGIVETATDAGKDVAHE